MQKQGRGDAALRRYRVSIPHTSYFLTLCTNQRAQGLHQPPVANALQSESRAMERDSHWQIRAGVIMPDHIHLFIRLATSLSLSRCVARFKSKTNAPLKSQGLAWQSNFYEHRLRPDESPETVIRYIHLNPYRSGIAKIDDIYPWFFLGENEKEWFQPETDQGRPYPEWLR